jgi:hypothetical protein
MRVKFNTLNHRIESLMYRKKIDISLIINMDEMINEFDVLYNDLQFPFSSSSKTKVI